MLTLVMSLGCGGDNGDDDPGTTDTFDRAAMLANWADNLIVPLYNRYFQTVTDLQTQKDAFLADQTNQSLEAMRTAFEESYIAWQDVSMFEIGPAETITLRNFTNIFPTNTQEIEDNVASGTANLELPSTNDAQGFPALDYLLFGVAADDASILTRLSETNYKNYLSALVDRLWNMADEVRTAWRTEGYRDAFVNDDGSSATSSVNKMVNDFMFYYEKALRAGKVGIPAGVFNGTPLSDRAEAPYHGALSRSLLSIALSNVISFFDSNDGPSLREYLDELDVRKDGELLSDLIRAQFQSASTAIMSLDDDLKTQVETDNSQLLGVYDELQKAVVLLKVDMFQALNIQVDFVDADGD